MNTTLTWLASALRLFYWLTLGLPERTILHEIPDFLECHYTSRLCYDDNPKRHSGASVLRVHYLKRATPHRLCILGGFKRWLPLIVRPSDS